MVFKLRVTGVSLSGRSAVSEAASTRRSRRRKTATFGEALQLNLPIPCGWGGRRGGAGRPAGTGRRCVPHRVRPAHRAAHPVHVTLRSRCRSLRSQFVFPTVRAALAAANGAAPDRFRIVEFSVQGDHIHLIVEAQSRSALVAGVRGLSVRIARRVNQLLGRHGRFFADRWHGRALESPRAVRNALVYVLSNFKKHRQVKVGLLDALSSALYFRDFVEFPSDPPIVANPRLHPRSLGPPFCAVVPAMTWLLSIGWKRHGRLSVAERPAE